MSNRLRRFFYLGFAAVFVMGCAKDSSVIAKNDPAPATPPPSSTATTDTPASGQVSPPISKVADPPAANSAALAANPAAPPPAHLVVPTVDASSVPSGNPSTGTYVFKYAPAGGTINYKTTSSIDLGQGQPFPMTQMMSDKITKNSDGSFTVVSTTTGGPAFGGAAKPIVQTSTVDSKGKVLSSKSAGAEAKMDPFGASGGLNAFPDHPVKVGDTWTVNGGNEKTGGGMVCKLVKVENKGGNPIATIQIIDLKIPPTSGIQVKLTKPGLLLMEVNTGVVDLMKLEAEAGIATTGSIASGSSGMKMPTKMKLQMKMEKQ